MVQTHSKVQASQEATKEVSKPYVHQLLDNMSDTEPQCLGDATLLRGANVDIPIETMKDHHLELCDSIFKFLSTANNLDIHFVNKIGSSYSECTYADISVNKLKVRAIIDTGAPINVMSSKLVRQMGLSPDIGHKKQYGTAGLDCTTDQGTYSTLPLRFGSLAVSAPDIVLPNESYNILIGTLVMRQYGVKTDLENDVLKILGQVIPLYYNHSNPEMGSQTTPCVNLAYCNGVVPVKYHKLGRQVKHLLTQVEEYKGLLLHTNSSYTIPAGHQVLMNIGLDLQIPQGLYREIETPWNCSRIEPLVAHGIVLPNYGPIKVLFANLNHSPVEVKHHQIVAYLHLLPVEEMMEIHNFGTLDEFGLPSEELIPSVVCTIIPQEQLKGLIVAQQDTALALFEKYKGIFAKDDFDLGCAHNTLQHINTGKEFPIHLCPIQPSRASDAAVNEEIGKLVQLGLLVSSKSP
ncbi:DNA damage-inducible protein 1 [Entomophthora muscae]|uniref:DNA damage-inducible protein 1 n=1 Tax=Entomophthora muscae TaxID=34485 RepID=A0ACC2RMR7_9FUNG|nr:DNA damage-inducible protein 1 [Entomophthora muscae]